MPETCISSLGEEDPLKKEMGTGLSILCLENSMHRGAWWDIVHGVAKELDMTQQLNNNKLYVTLERGKTFHRLTQH